ncbi:hypothetical protein [Sediminitomix flava]|uniref:Uncharacterized protein n=1 Tax=Sediminitomix flava TaxID=379075 RepID=A0A315ZF55_SEDFL|nr:hypothetical protein [Sediminitomix flava]PWJ43789.1 hypothetical protein BC781_101135 [Sediminitomix flava]
MKTSEIKLLSILFIFLFSMLVDSGLFTLDLIYVLAGIFGVVGFGVWAFLMLKKVHKPSVTLKSQKTTSIRAAV